MFDMGASLAISHDTNDFNGPVQAPPTPKKIGGMANGLETKGEGSVMWSFHNLDRSEMKICTECHCHVPEAWAHLVSPQRPLFNKAKGLKKENMKETRKTFACVFKDVLP